MSLSGVFFSCSIAWANFCVSRLPLLPMFSLISRLAVFTPNSALQLEWGLWAMLTLWWTPQSHSTFCIAVLMNSGPWSVLSISGIPSTLQNSVNQSAVEMSAGLYMLDHPL